MIAETASQAACREWWQARQPHVTRAWGRDKKTGAFLAEEARALHAAWVEAYDSGYEQKLGNIHCTGPVLTEKEMRTKLGLMDEPRRRR